MRTIFKYKLDSVRNFHDMPIGAQVLAVQMQDGIPCLWALVDSLALMQRRRFDVWGTGDGMPDDPGIYVGTIQMVGGALVFHVFESRSRR